MPPAVAWGRRFLRSYSLAFHARSSSPLTVKMPRRSMAAAAVPSLGWGSRVIPWAARLRWSTRATHRAHARASLHCVAQRSRNSTR